MKKLEDFTDDLVFDYDTTNKHIIYYLDYQDDIEITDYQGNTELIEQCSGNCLLPTTYVLGKSDEYADLIEESTKRAKFRE